MIARGGCRDVAIKIERVGCGMTDGGMQIWAKILTRWRMMEKGEI